jgi:aromatic ring-cleaving dioxygenase
MLTEYALSFLSKYVSTTTLCSFMHHIHIHDYECLLIQWLQAKANTIAIFIHPIEQKQM